MTDSSSFNSTTALTTAVKPRRVPRYVTVSAWLVPVLVLGQFSMLAIIPVALVLFGSVQSSRVRGLRPLASLLAALYATPLAIWILRPDGAQSLSKDMNPVFAGLIVAASVLVLIRIYVHKRQPTL